jgi:HEAT repeat protein
MDSGDKLKRFLDIKEIISNDLVYSENYFEYLAIHDRIELNNLLLNNQLMPEDLTFAAEIAGQTKDFFFENALVQLLNHPEAVVREGAIYGLLALDEEKSLKHFEKLTQDPSATIRLILKNLNE